MQRPKVMLGISVLQAARDRIAWTFDRFPKICVSFSAGKDSTVMLHLVMEEAIKRKQKVAVLFIDLEAQYKLTIEHALHCFELYRDHIEPFWISLPLHLRNAVSQYQPHWVCWDPTCPADWVRQPPEIAITDPAYFPFFHHAMEFEEFVEQFGGWYGAGASTACFVGIRADESLNRWRTIAAQNKSCYDGKRFTTWKGGCVFNIYPIYDWKAADIWAYHGKTGKAHNHLYDLMHKAGLTLTQMRICQPYGDDQRRGLWLFHLIEPETWSRIVARVNGANSGALYVRESGNIMGNLKISKPEGHTWQSFANLLLESQPKKTREHFENKILVFIRWYQMRGFPNGIPDEADSKAEAARELPSWRRVCKALLRNDYWCKGLSFTQHESKAYAKYLQIMKRRKQKWNLQF